MMKFGDSDASDDDDDDDDDDAWSALETNTYHWMYSFMLLGIS